MHTIEKKQVSHRQSSLRRPVRSERRPHGESRLGSVDNAAVAAVFAEMGEHLAIGGGDTCSRRCTLG
jgi:hypothetical protein